MELNGRKWNQIIKVLPLLRTPESRPTPIPLSGCRGRSRTALTSCHPQRTPNPPTIPPQRSVQQTTSTRQIPVANMSQSEYDDSNAAAKTRFRPPARVTHLHTPTRFLPAWRGLLLPGPSPGVAKVHHRSLSLSQRLSPAVAPPTLVSVSAPAPSTREMRLNETE